MPCRRSPRWPFAIQKLWFLTAKIPLPFNYLLHMFYLMCEQVVVFVNLSVRRSNCCSLRYERSNWECQRNGTETCAADRKLCQRIETRYGRTMKRIAESCWLW